MLEYISHIKEKYNYFLIIPNNFSQWILPYSCVVGCMSSLLNFSVTFSPRSPHPLGSLVPTVSSPKLRMGWSRIGWDWTG